MHKKHSSESIQLPDIGKVEQGVGLRALGSQSPYERSDYVYFVAAALGSSDAVLETALVG